MRWIKQSTSIEVPIGPFLDSTDGVTAETGLTITQPDIRLKKNGGAWAQKAAAQTLSHEENGNYEVTLDATDTSTLGLLRLHVIEAGALPVWENFMVMSASAWDSMFAAPAGEGTADSGTTTTMVDSARTEGDTDYWKYQIIYFKSGNIAGQARIITGFNPTTDTITFFPATTQAVTTQQYEIWPGMSAVGLMATDVINATAVAASANAAIADQVWDEALAGHLGAGTTGASLNSASSAGDPWATALPGAYSSGSAGKMIGDNVNATISSRSSHSAVDVWAAGTRTLTSFGTLVADVATAIWGAATRILTAATNITSTGGTTVPQTGDNFARIGAAGAGLTALGDTRVANLDATVSSRATPAQVATALDTYDPPTKAEIDAALALLATAANLALVKAKTDQMVFSTANLVDVRVNNVAGKPLAVGGTGGQEIGEE